MVCRVRNVSALAVAPSVVPRKMVIKLISSFCAVFDSLSTTPDSLRIFPSISMLTRVAAEGNMRATRIVTTTANRILSVFDTGLSWAMTI